MSSRKRRRRRRKGWFSIILGLLLLIGALGLALYNYWDGDRAAKASSEIQAKLVNRMKDKVDPSSDRFHTVPMGDPSLTPYREMPTEEIDGYLYIGVLDLPSLDLSLPVMAEWDYERLKISPCRYSGSYYTDDLVICAHNYQRHFSPIKGINMGADIYFTNVRGETIHYVTSNIETVQPTNIEEMIENTGNSFSIKNEWDMTLFTCNTGGQTRCAVRCTRVNDNSILSGLVEGEEEENEEDEEE